MPFPDEFRDWQITSKFGFTKTQIEEQPAVWLDWMLAIDAEVESAKQDAQRKAEHAG